LGHELGVLLLWEALRASQGGFILGDWRICLGGKIVRFSGIGRIGILDRCSPLISCWFEL
jgi:hypothetical protein